MASANVQNMPVREGSVLLLVYKDYAHGTSKTLAVCEAFLQNRLQRNGYTGTELSLESIYSACIHSN
jgi:hypothetical protein